MRHRAQWQRNSYQVNMRAAVNTAKPMHEPTQYRILARHHFVIAMIALICPLAVGVWLGLDQLDSYLAKLEQLAATAPNEAGLKLKQFGESIAIANAVVLTLFAALIIRHGWRGWQSQAMPPRGSWIIEGQRTWAGEHAVRIAQFTVAVGVILMILGVASSALLWDLGRSISVTQ